MNIPSGGHEIPATSNETPTVTLPVTYPGVDAVPVVFANQFIVQRERDVLILGVGQLTPPVVLGADPEERAAQLRTIASVPVMMLARYSITRERALELRDLLDRQVQEFDQGHAPMEVEHAR